MDNKKENMDNEKDFIREALLFSVNKAKDNYANDVVIRSSIILLISAWGLIKTPLTAVNIFHIDLPAPYFYIMIAISIFSSLTFGTLGYIRGLPLFDVEKSIESGKAKEAKAILEDMSRKNKRLDIFENICLIVSVLLIFIPFNFAYHAECPYCKAEISVDLSVCSECDSETDFNKDIVKYITAHFSHLE